ncbi:hypothetical protein G7054_g1228 [Neopestalotiopsis clavispora]|nr:hypothetical protein G7054_g1228 [Neopestalotiopsis clavispora]
MLKAFQEKLPLSDWRCHHAYLEACQYGDPLNESDIASWAWRRDAFATPPEPSHRGSPNARLRILFTQTTSRFRGFIPEVLVNAHVLEALQLPPHTFRCTVESCSRIGLVFRTPHIRLNGYQIGGYAVSHDFDTATTTALILGNCFDLDRDDDRVRFEVPRPKLEEFANQVRDCGHLWRHPLLLPCLLLGLHARLVHSHIRKQSDPTLSALETVIGVTTRKDQKITDADLHKILNDGGDNSEFKSDPSHRLTGELFVDGQLQRKQAKTLTQLINSISKRMTYLKRSPQWDLDCVKFLRRILDASPRLSNHPSVPAQTFRETLDYVESYSEVCLEVTVTSEARVQLHLNIVGSIHSNTVEIAVLTCVDKKLYTSVAQDDGETSAKLAAAAGRDSTSMKIIALITAAYLPATFVATLFSMGMFEWKSNGPDADGAGTASSSISPDFWMYWAVTIPLTVITLAGWGFWWKFEESRFDETMKKAEKGIPSDQSHASEAKKSGSKDFLPFLHGRREHRRPQV